VKKTKEQRRLILSTDAQKSKIIVRWGRRGKTPATEESKSKGYFIKGIVRGRGIEGCGGGLGSVLLSKSWKVIKSRKKSKG